MESYLSGGWDGILSIAETDSDRPSKDPCPLAKSINLEVGKPCTLLYGRHPRGLMGPAAARPGASDPRDLAGDWVLAFDLYGETNHQRMTVETAGDRITVAASGLKLEERDTRREAGAEAFWKRWAASDMVAAQSAEQDGMAT